MEKIKDKKVLNNLKQGVLVNIICHEDGERVFYDSRIEEVGRNVVFVSVPKSKGKAFILAPGQAVEVSFILGETRYIFETVVMGNALDHMPVLKLKYPRYILQHELREYFRVYTDFIVRVYQQSGGEYVEVRCVDISAGGIRICGEHIFPINSDIEIDFVNQVEDLNIIHGKVVRSMPGSTDCECAHGFGVEFGNIRESERNAIIKYVFSKQLFERREL